MDNLKEEVIYLYNLLKSNIEKAKKCMNVSSDKDIEEIIFNNLNVKSDETEIAFYNSDTDTICCLNIEDIYTMYRKLLNEVKEHPVQSVEFMSYAMLVYYIPRLIQYSNKEITIEEFIENGKMTNPVVKKILEQKNNIIDQLKLLKENNNLPEVQEYIAYIQNEDECSSYVRYLISTYYYGEKDLIEPEKNGLEEFGDLILS